MNGERSNGRLRNRGVLGIVLLALLTMALGLLHVVRVKEEMALRRGIWNEIRKARALDDERARIRHQITELLAIPRTTVKAEVMGLRPVGRDQILELGGPEE